LALSGAFGCEIIACSKQALANNEIPVKKPRKCLEPLSVQITPSETISHLKRATPKAKKLKC